MARRRIWCELLPADELGAPATVALLDRLGLEPLVALPPDRQDAAMAEALARISRRGVRLGLWPLLSDEDGYWPSEHNAAAFCARVRDTLSFADSAGARVATIAVDLEPPLALARSLMTDPPLARARTLARESVAALGRERRRVRRAAVDQLSDLAAQLHQQGIETLAAAIPPVVADLVTGTGAWQAALRTPALAAGWGVLSPMMYTTMIAALLPGRSARAARALLFAAGVALRRYRPTGCGLSLGLVDSGKLGDEPRYRDPDELAVDVALARAAGVDDLALFSLEGTLRRGAPERWLTPYTADNPRMPVRFRVP